MTWPDVERALGDLPHRVRVAVAVRAARRVLPAVGDLEAVYGEEAREWLAVCEDALAKASTFVRGEMVSRFQLDLAADGARCAANATAHMARQVGPSPLMEVAELAYAAVAFTADAARTANTSRSADYSFQAVRAAAGGGTVPPDLKLDLLTATSCGEIADPGPDGPFGPL